MVLCELKCCKIDFLTFHFDFVIFTPNIIIKIKVHKSNFDGSPASNLNLPITVSQRWIIARPPRRSDYSRSRGQGFVIITTACE